MIPLMLTAAAAYKSLAGLLDDDRRRAAEPEPSPNHHPLLVAAGVAVAAGLLTRAVVRKRRYFDLDGRVVVLTGGSRGLGLAVARRLVDKGARLALCARDEADLRDAQDDLRDRGGDAFAAVCDVTDPAQVRAFLGQVRDAVGPVDVLINNAGMIAVGPAENMTADDYDDAMRTHFYGPLAFILELLPEMRRRGAGRICNVASVGGRVALPHLVPYAASKFALVGLGEGLRAESAKHGVYVTTVCPGTIRTGSTRAAEFKGDEPAEFEAFADAAYAPGASISADRMAAKIVDAIEHGDAEVIAPLVAKVQTMFHGVAPGVGVELLALLDRLMPAAKPGDTSAATGRKADVGQLSAYTAEMQERAAAAYHQS